jgi:GSCFA family
MNFTTQIPISKSNNPIDYKSHIMSIGSCFAENMSEKFNYFKFNSTTNPFGIIFNPVSIEKLISRVVNQELFTEKDIFFYNERWNCYEVHSELSSANKEEFLQNLNSILQSTHNQITKSTHFIITYGTSWVYKNIETNEIVANCHKVPQKQFDKELLSIDTIQKSIENTVKLIQKINPTCHFIFTVSPVRHIKDGFVENNISKAHLISSIHSIDNSQHTTHNYFPSYEIMMDELRDYRFYGKDMLHPNQTAIDYIWIKFFENYFSETEFQTMQQVCDIQKALHHKPFNENSETHQQFLLKLQGKIRQIQQNFPQIQF